MAIENIYQGSTIELEILLTQDDGTPLNPNDVDDVIVLFRYADGKQGALKKFKKTASGAEAAWTAPDAAEGKLVCKVPASDTQNAAVAKVIVEIKVKKAGQYEHVTLLDNSFNILKSQLADD